MTQTQRLLGLVMARGGSKRMPNKNALPLAGKSLIQRSLETAKASTRLDWIGFSSDSLQYVDLARQAGVDDGYRRPPELAQDGTSSMASALHYLDWLEERGQAFSHVVLLQPTSPFRGTHTIDDAIDQWRRSTRESLVSVTPAVPASSVMVYLSSDDASLKVENKEKCAQAFILDGCIYITPVQMLRDGRGFWDEQSALYINIYPKPYDIDTAEDFRTAELMVESGVFGKTK